MELDDGKLGVISVFGLIKDVKLKFLLDTGASHNFLSLHDAKSLGLPVYYASATAISSAASKRASSLWNPVITSLLLMTLCSRNSGSKT